VNVAHGKGIELLSDVALTEEAQMKEVCKKSLRDFYKTHPSGLGVPDVTNNDSSESESESWENDEDDNNNEQESSDESSKQENDSDEQELDLKQDGESKDDNQDEEEVDQDNESKDDEMKSDEEQGMDDTTDQFDDDADARLEEPTETATEIVQGKGTNAEMTEAQQGNENLATTQEQVVDDAHVTITTVTKKTEVPVTSSSCSSDLASKFLNFSDIPHTDAEIVSPLDVPVYHEFPRTQAPTLLSIPVFVIPESSPIFTNIPQSSHIITPFFRFNNKISALEKEVVELKKDPLHTQVTSLVDEHLDTRLGETREEFMNLLSESFTTRIKEQLFHETRDEVTLAKASSQPQSTYEAASTLTKFELKKILLDKIKKSESYLTAPEHQECYDGLSWTLLLDHTEEEPVFEVVDSDMPHNQEGNLGDNEDEPRKETASRSDWFKKPTPPQEPTDPDWNIYKALTESCWENPKGGDYPFYLSKPLPLITHGKRQRVPFEFFINNDLKYLQGGISIMTYTTSTTKTKAAKYDLPSIEYMVPSIWIPVKVAYDKYALWCISHWREQRKSFYAYARGMQSRRDVYSTKLILAVTHVSVMRKHRYGYLKEIVVRRADNVLYRCKEGDFSRLRINDIEDMLILMVQNRLINLSGDDIADFAIVLRMFIRSLVIQKRVKDLQLGVESYQKQINVTKP
ncbi:hypothetical protein Tco_1425912, partial [Tanacetum coccineum]